MDFANIGSNDLLQYTVAGYRGNPLVEKRYHILHPSLQSTVKLSTRDNVNPSSQVLEEAKKGDVRIRLD